MDQSEGSPADEDPRDDAGEGEGGDAASRADGGADEPAGDDEAVGEAVDSGVDVDTGVDEVPLEELRLEATWRIEAPRPFVETVRLYLALLVAGGLHAAALLPLSSYSATAQLGAGGEDLQSISVEIVTVTRQPQSSVKRDDNVRPSGLRGVPADVAGGDVASLAQDAQAESVASSGRQGRAPDDEADAARSALAKAPLAAEPERREDPDALAGAVIRGAERAGAEDGAETGEAAPLRPDGATDKSAEAPRETRAKQAEADGESEQPKAVGSAGAEASDAAQAGGGERLASVEPSAGDGSQSRAAGIIATAYSAEIVKSLRQLEQYLTTQNNERKSAVRGRVELILTIGEDGRARDVRIVTSSGQVALDEIARRDLLAFRFPEPPPALSIAARTYRLPITYR